MRFKIFKNYEKSIFSFTSSIFSLGIYASNNPLKGDNSIKEDADVQVDEEFPVYCNGVYWGTAESIDEAIWM